MYTDRIDLTLPEADVATLLAAFTSAEASLEFLPSVSTPDRKRYAKLGLKNESLAKQIIEVGRANPDLIPRGINFEKIDRDLIAREQLRTLKIILERLLGRVNDAMLLTGVDIYAAALSIYHCLRRNADTASLKEVVDELKRGFARPSRKKKEQQEDAASPASALAHLAEPAAHPPQLAPVASERPSTETVPTAPPSATAASVTPQERHARRLSLSLTPRTLGATPPFDILPHPPITFFSGGFTPSAFPAPLWPTEPGQS